MGYEYINAIGQDSHRFIHLSKREDGSTDIIRGQKLGGVWIPDSPRIDANSDGDVILHALTNAVSGITGVNILGKRADQMCLSEGTKDSAEYLKAAITKLGERQIIHASISVECKTPRLESHIDDIRLGVSKLLCVPVTSVGLTATSGEELTAFGRGEGIMVTCSITVRQAQRES